MLTLDPFVSTHRASENDNNSIDAVVKTLGRIAGAASIAIELIHHVRKTGGADVTAEDSRGASATVAAARSVRTLNRMSTGDAEKAGLDDEIRRRTFRAETDKANLAPPEKARWFQLRSVALGNGSHEDQDYIGVVEPWQWPNAFDGVSVSDLRAVQTAIAASRWRESPQAKDWAGLAVASVLRLDPATKANKAKIASLLKTWIAKGMLVVADGEDDKRMPRKFIEVGEPAND